VCGVSLPNASAAREQNALFLSVQGENARQLALFPLRLKCACSIMQRSNHVPFSEGDRLGWTRYGNLDLPPDIAALLYGSGSSSFDGHVPPASASNARDFSSEGTGRAQIAVVDGRSSSPSEPEGPIPSNAPCGDSGAQRIQPPPRMIPRRRLAASTSRACGHCRQLGHTRKSCPALGHAPLDFNRNATEVLTLAPHVPRRSNAVVQQASEGAALGLVLADAPVAPNLSDHESSEASGGSQSVSDADDVAADGFDGLIWKLEFDSRLPSSDSNQCAPPPPPVHPRRRRRRSNGSESSSSSDESMAGAPPFCRDKSQPAATRIPRECKTPASFVRLLFPDSFIADIVRATNAAARTHPRLKDQARFAKWKECTDKEMWIFLAICVYLGVVKIQNRKLIWKQGGGVFHQAWVSRVMTLRRFECLLNAWNCCIYWTLSAEEAARRNADNCFWQIDELVRECNRLCATHFKMGRAFSIDEAVIPWKGRHRARCYNPSKPAKYHFKKFALNCATTGYVYCQYHYAGKDERRPANVPASLWPIKKLVDQCPSLHNKDHLCSTDNWYTSAQSLSYFRGKGIHCTGTIKKGRLAVETATSRGFPSVATFKPMRGQPRRARADCMIHSTAVDGHAAYVTSWQDKKPVLLLSSYRPSGGDCLRKVKVAGTWTQQRFFRPNVINHYNKTMGGTDLHDQRLSIIRSTVKSRRWQVRSL
jgi:hypothetical protein